MKTDENIDLPLW